MVFFVLHLEEDSVLNTIVSFIKYPVEFVIEHPWLTVSVCSTGVAGYFLIKVVTETKEKLPPGPIGSPMHLFTMLFKKKSKNPHKEYMKWKKKYGDIFTVSCEPYPVIYLASYEAMTECFVNNADDFSDYHCKSHQPGVLANAFSSGPYHATYIEEKNLIVKALRVSDQNTKILNQIMLMIDRINLLDHQPIDFSNIAIQTTANIISDILFSESYEYDDRMLLSLIELVKHWYSDLNKYYASSYRVPWWYYKLKGQPYYDQFQQSNEELEDLVKQHVAFHKETFNKSNLRDFTDAFLDKQQNVEEDELSRSFYENIMMFLPDAINTVAVLMRWVLLYITLHQDVQHKMHEELYTNIGHGLKVTVSDRWMLPYNEAVILEVMRVSDVSQGVGRRTMCKETKLRGYTLPEGSIVTASLYCVHKDPDLFPNPEMFDPTRFISHDGRLTNTKHVIPFGIGSRSCIGQTLVMNEIFLFITNLLQNFNVTFPIEDPPPSVEPQPGAFQYPRPFNVVFTRRLNTECAESEIMYSKVF